MRGARCPGCAGRWAGHGSPGAVRHNTCVGGAGLPLGDSKAAPRIGGNLADLR